MSDDSTTDDDCSTTDHKPSIAERTALIVSIIGFFISEALPFIERCFGIQLDGHGIFHIIHGLLKSDCGEIQEGVEDIVIQITETDGDITEG